MNARIYAVSNKADGSKRLVKAGTPAQAMRHVANALFDVKTVTALQVAELLSGGVKLENAAQEPEPTDQKEEVE